MKKKPTDGSREAVRRDRPADHRAGVGPQCGGEPGSKGPGRPPRRTIAVTGDAGVMSLRPRRAGGGSPLARFLLQELAQFPQNARLLAGLAGEAAEHHADRSEIQVRNVVISRCKIARKNGYNTGVRFRRRFS